jgi:outer membrane autotransporter protein
LGARASYDFPLENENITPYAAAGLAIHIFKAEVDIPGTGASVDNSETKIGIDLAGGAAFKVGDNVDIVAELMYRIVSDVAQFVVSGGAVFWFGG